MRNTWKTRRDSSREGGKKLHSRAVIRSISLGSADHGKVDPRDYTPNERIFHAPCIFLPDVSNPRHIGRAPNFPRRWEARDRKARSNLTRASQSLQ